MVEDTRTGGKLFYAPGLGKVDDALMEKMSGADCLLVDGTMWDDDEMKRRGVGTRTGTEMGHLAQNGPGGMLQVLEKLPKQRKVLIHINNTNPILDEDSPERAELARRDVEVAFDGMSIEL
jgi:pyrroloquinoline quinone biosynthesis protein B